MTKKWTKTEAYAHFGASLVNVRWSWSARTPDGKTVVISFWCDRYRWETTPNESMPATTPARLLTKARILLKADASAAGEAWSDSQIAAALDTSVDTVARTRQQLVEEGFEAVLTRKRFAGLGQAAHL